MKTRYRIIVIAVISLFIVTLAYGIMRFLISIKEEPPGRRSFEFARLLEAKLVICARLIFPVVESGYMSNYPIYAGK